MGGCSSKNAPHAQDAPGHPEAKIQAGRRRLSVSQASPVPQKDGTVIGGKPGGGEADEVRGTIGRAGLTDEDDLATMLPKANRRCSVFGAPAQEMQRGYDNKRMEVQGEMNAKTLVEMGVGYACKKGLKPESPNQDDFFILTVEDWSLFGVFDGHGPSGHDVSNFVHKNLPKLIVSDPNFETEPLTAIKQAFRKVHDMLQVAANSNDGFDCALSGTTATVVLHRKNKLFVGHVGDSRAVLAAKAQGGKRLTAMNLTQDHKPTREDEKKRIQQHGGEVRRLDGDIPHRVFVKGKMYPGLAMSRAIGDVVGSSVGVVPDPDVKELTLEEGRDQFFLLCSDGVWEFISSQEAVDIISKQGRKQVQEATEHLTYEAWRRWVAEEENVVDDITAIVRWITPPA
ncbi:unnamed protein product [Vitrella brassicaformis CCMP3155]|uniref:PPM-type phosphatase domain-containing protein n=2 Tax=Vitrella brassicaformis TaxID=1169539 RepID=A0A0G4GPB6_VITBC|nr:unnamed protein product [Vitrella brassicaformis CCMP3155]|eukprot:CEM32017.1 unnamed protein product [Vitrella brassicaformis CCMP3155]